MELKIKQSDFMEALKWTQGIAERKSTMPVLSNVLLAADEKGLAVMATDLELSIRIQVPCQAKKNGEALVNAKGLFDIVREAPNKEIKLSGKKEAIEVTSGKSEFKVLGMPTSEFPAFPDNQNYEWVSFQGSGLLEMIDRTSYAVSTDETRYALNGVYLEKPADSETNGLRMVATDGHRLSYIDREVTKAFKLPEGVIVPRKGLSLIKKLAETADQGLKLGLGQKELIVVREPKDEADIGVTFYVRLIEGKFPKYQQVIPKNAKRLVTLPRKSLVGALRRADIMAQDRAHPVCFALSPGHLEISSSNPDLGEVKEELEAEYKGETFQVGFNARYFLDVLNVLADEQIVLVLGDELSPCIIRSEFDRGFLALIMPMRL